MYAIQLDFKNRCFSHSNNYVQADETSLQVLKEEGKLAQSKSYMWVYRTGPPAKEVIVYEYQANRNGEHVTNFLKDFTGYLQTDGYAGYKERHSQEKITAVYCIVL